MRLLCLGDSLMQYNGPDTYPQEGWPQELNGYLRPGVEILNFAKNGRSTKSFIDEGIFEQALRTARAGDIVLISFGHNDEKKEDPSRYSDPEENGDYERNLSFMAETMRCKDAIPIFLSSIVRYKVEDGRIQRTHGEYPFRMKKTAHKYDVNYIPLNEITYEEFNKDLLAAEENYMILPPGKFKNYENGLKDTTHLCQKGAKLIASLIAKELIKLNICKSLFLEAKED